MRKGALNRFSIVVATLSLASFVPVAYFHYKSTAPSAYVCNESLSSNGELTCSPYSYEDYSVNLADYSFGHPAYIQRPIGYTPEFIISKSYLRKYYKHIIHNTGSNIPVAPPGEIGKEMDKLGMVLKKTSDNLKPHEEKYIYDTLGLTITTCLILPFLTLMVLYILRFLLKFIVHGRSTEANT